MNHLLQIHEPGQTPAPHAGDEQIAIGIDLGTTHSVVAYASRTEKGVQGEGGSPSEPSARATSEPPHVRG